MESIEKIIKIFLNIWKPTIKTSTLPTIKNGSIQVSDNSAVTDWGHLIYSYVTNMYGTVYDSKREDRARKEIEGRGLAFGQIKITGGNSHSVKLELSQKFQRTSAEAFKSSLEEILKKRGLNDHLKINEDSHMYEVRVIFKDQADQTFNGATWSGFCNNQPVSWKEFLSASYLSGHNPAVTIYSDEALRVVIQVAELLGFSVGPKHYSHESSFPIEDIVVCASRWEDPKSGCRYLDVVWKPELVMHHVCYGSNRSDRREVPRLKKDALGSDCKNGDELWPLKGEVLACIGQGDWWPKITINNRPVYSTIIKKPTQAILNAREKFIQESVRRCACGKPATQRIMLVRFEVEDGFGGCSSGGINYACDSETCLNMVKSSKCVRAEVSPYKQESWE